MGACARTDCTQPFSICQGGIAWESNPRVVVTMDIYLHVLPGMQEDAAAKVGSILF